MSNTSGIPDYFTSEVVKELTTGKDQSWGFERAITECETTQTQNLLLVKRLNTLILDLSAIR